MVLDVVRVGAAVVELFRRSDAAKPDFLRPLEPVLRIEPVHLLHNRAVVAIGNPYDIGNVGIVIADVSVPLVAHRAHHIVRFIKTIPRGEHVTPRFNSFWSQECPSLHMSRNGHSGYGHNRRPQIDGTDQLVVHTALQQFPRPSHDQRHERARLIGPPLAPGQAVAVIAPEKHNSIFGKTFLFQFAEVPAYDGIQTCNLIVEPGKAFTYFFRVGIIRRHLNVGGVGEFRFLPGLAFVGQGIIEYGKKWLIHVGAVPVMRAVAAFVPRGERRLVRPGELVIGFDIVGAVVTMGPHVLRKGLYVMRRHCCIGCWQFAGTTTVGGAHMVTADRGLVHPGDYGRAVGGAYRRRGMEIGKAHAL